jgi:hypothetical protein
MSRHKRFYEAALLTVPITAPNGFSLWREVVLNCSELSIKGDSCFE